MQTTAQIITITPQELNSIIQQAAEASSARAVERLELKLAEQRDYYENLLPAETIAAELKCSVESVYRYWREGKLKHSQIRPSEKGSSKAQIAEFRQNLARKRD